MMRAVVTAILLVSLGSPAAADTTFRFPGSDEHRQHFYVTAYRDLDGGGGQLDWGCGTKTYGGHGGTDMGVGGFPGMDAGRDVVAAASGTVTAVVDGVFDRCTTGNCAGGGGFGNYVRIEHEDGMATYYGHLKKFSITVAVGDTVSCGQKIGQVGSSGRSTGPHLHFEPRVNGNSDDPFTGPCGGPISWWVEQGPYLELPQTTCQDAPPRHPLLSMASELEPIEGQEPDLYPEGSSAEVFDLVPGQSVTARLLVTADETAFKSPNVVLGVDAPGGFLTVRDWQVFDDFADCGEPWCPNDANENPANPPQEAPGESFDLHLNAMSPGETKMLVLTLEYAAPTEGEAPHARVNLWVKQIEGTYAKPAFDADPENVDGSQSFNGGDLKQQILIDTWSESGPEEPEPFDPQDPEAEGDLGGGCAAAPGGAGGGASFALLLLVIARRRRPLRTRVTPQ